MTYSELTITVSSKSLNAIDPTFIRAGLYANSFGSTILYEVFSRFSKRLPSNYSDWGINPL